MFNILIHEGNANQNNTEIPSYPCQNDCYQENKWEAIEVTTFSALSCPSTLIYCHLFLFLGVGTGV
jgi:hypothetical protein